MSAGCTIEVSVILILVVNFCTDGTPLDSRLHSRQNSLARNGSSKIALADLRVDQLDGTVPNYFKNALVNVTLTVDTASNSYLPHSGILRLRKAISKLYSKLINNDLNPETEVVITVGATEALFSAIMALTSPGDEWILIEPFFTTFQNPVKLAKAVPRFTNLKPSKMLGNLSAADWQLDYNEFENLINNKTRGIIFNNPNNPLGKCFNQSEIEFISELAKQHDLLIISDQVHEFSADSIIRIASMPGMFERTLSIGSASKAFNLPGWRIGWMYGSEKLINFVKTFHGDAVQFPSSLQQEAIASVFEDEIASMNLVHSNSFLTQNLANVKRKRDFIVQACHEAGMIPIVPQGGYCMLVTWPTFNDTDFLLDGYYGLHKDQKFAKWMKEENKVDSNPAGIYYNGGNRSLGYEYLRFCYQKSEETLQRAAENLLKLRRFEKN